MITKAGIIMEKCFKNNDIYFIEKVKDKIIINDNYKGITILDSKLEIIKSVSVFDEIVFDKSYIKDREIILYCYENECFVYFNTDTFGYKVIPIEKSLSGISFLSSYSIYEWEGNELIILADDGSSLVRINAVKGIVQKEDAENGVHSIKNNWEKLRKLQVHKVYPSYNTAVIEMDNIVKKVNYVNGLEECIAKIEDEFHDVEVYDDFCALISERGVSIMHSGETIKSLKCHNGFRFLRGKFINNKQDILFLVLSSSNADSSVCFLQEYSF